MLGTLPGASHPVSFHWFLLRWFTTWQWSMRRTFCSVAADRFSGDLERIKLIAFATWARGNRRELSQKTVESELIVPPLATRDARHFEVTLKNRQPLIYKKKEEKPFTKEPSFGALLLMFLAKQSFTATSRWTACTTLDEKEPSSRFAARRTLFHVWYHARSRAISAGQKLPTVADRTLPCTDRSWSSISHVEQRSSRRESRGWFFFFLFCPW